MIECSNSILSVNTELRKKYTNNAQFKYQKANKFNLIKIHHEY